jgi:diol dehydratase reactivase alpha subunit
MKSVRRVTEESKARFIAGVDIGNSTTEAAIACRRRGELNFLGSGCAKTTGIKGTPENLEGIRNALLKATENAGHTLKNLDVICINAATPVIGDLSMSTITETIITESAMIGHNPDTPGGVGIGSGRTILSTELSMCSQGDKVIPVIPGHISFHNAAKLINEALKKSIDVQAAIVQNNEGVLISNRVERTIPIVDEVTRIEAVPIDMPAVVEVAEPGRAIETLSNPYGIASLLDLNPKETRKIAPIAISLTGNRSAVVIKTPKGAIKERKISVGKLTVLGARHTHEIDVALGADQLLLTIEKTAPLVDVHGQPGTAVGGMLHGIKHALSLISRQPETHIKVRDLFAADTIVPQKIKGGMAGEYSLNKAIGLAAMVWSDKPMLRRLMERVQAELGVPLKIGGTEIEMAILGALTTPGVEKPLVVLDMGGGSVDAARLDAHGRVKAVHLAGAGDLVTLLIGRELGIEDLALAEEIKIFPAAKVESLFHMQLEDGRYRFFKEPLDRRLFGRVVLLKPGDEMVLINKDTSLEKLVAIRQNAKKKVFVPNVLRALRRVLPGGIIRTADEIVLLGGSALDFEMPGIVSDMLLRDYGVVTGRGNVRGALGPRNAVATGLILSFYNRSKDRGNGVGTQ